MNQKDLNIQMIQNALFDQEDERRIKVCVHSEKTYKHLYEESIGTVEITNVDKEPIFISILPWVVPVEMEEKVPLSQEQVDAYLKGIENITQQKERMEITAWVTSHEEEFSFFRYTPWFFLFDWKYDKKTDNYNHIPYKKNGKYYLFSLTLVGPKKLKTSDFMTIHAMIDEYSFRDPLIRRLREKLDEIKKS